MALELVFDCRAVMIRQHAIDDSCTLYDVRRSVIECRSWPAVNTRHIRIGIVFGKRRTHGSSFQHVRETCDYILSQKIQPEDTIYYPLVTAICVLYARPFKRSRGIEPLSAQFVPKKFQKLHKLVESVRDKTVAHIDTRSFDFKGLPANCVRFFIRDGEVRLEPHGVKFKLSLISEIRELVSALEKRMHEHSNKLVSHYQNDAPDDGEYLIDLTAGSLQPCTVTKSARSIAAAHITQ